MEAPLLLRERTPITLTAEESRKFCVLFLLFHCTYHRFYNTLSAREARVSGKHNFLRHLRRLLFQIPNQVEGHGASYVQSLFNGFGASLHGATNSQSPNFHHPQEGQLQAQNYGGVGAAMNQALSQGSEHE